MKFKDKLRSAKSQVIKKDKNHRLMAWEGKGGMKEDEKERRTERGKDEG